MKRFVLFLLLLLWLIHQAQARTENDSILQALDYELNRKAIYTNKKEEHIREIKQLLNAPNLTPNQQYTLNRQIYLEYRAYQTDSALFYLKNNLVIAQNLHDDFCYYETQLDLSYLYWQCGHFFEAVQNLANLDRNRFNILPDELLRTYYQTYKVLYRYYANAQADKQNDYYAFSNLYRDSLLQIAPVESDQYKVLTAEKLTDENRTQEAAALLLDLMDQSTTTDHEKAMFSNLLAGIYQKEGNAEMQKKYYAISAIFDIQNAVKENSSMQALALILFQEGNIDLAYKYIQSSIHDANFCNARFRTYEISRIFPIIDGAYQAKAAKQKNELRLYVLLVSILLVFLGAAVIFVYRQMRKIAKIRGELYDTNLKLNDLNTDLKNSNIRLHELNDELMMLNRQLSETNLVKEIYLGKFVDLCSNYIEKLDNYRRNLRRIATSGKMDELHAVLKSTKYIESELNEFYSNFDQTFLRIYPTFIENFNALFPDDYKQKPKSGELLNTVLRIYALIRLGIKSSSKIALFLRRSETTVYSYRSRLKSNSLFKCFLEEEVIKIG